MAGDDDTTADPLFKNIPRRPRTAASLPRNDGGDPGGKSISVSKNESPPATTTSVPSKKRPASSTGAGGGGAENVPRAKKKHRSVVPIEQPEQEDANDRGVGIFGGMPPPALLSRKHKAAAATVASSASSNESDPDVDVDWLENERRRKGKTPAVNEYAACAPRPLAGKLLGDAIRSHRSTAVAVGSFKPPSPRTTTAQPEKAQPSKPKKAAAKKKDRTKPNKPRKDPGAWFWCGVGSDGMSSVGSDADYTFDRLGVVSDRLRATLRSLGVGAPGPVRVYGRLMTRCDRDTQQTRLLMSCKRWRAGGAELPFSAFLTEGEKAAVNGDGMPLTAYDRQGDAYEIKLRFLECNVAYRIIGKWGDFLRRNGLVVVGKVEAPAPGEKKKKKKKKKKMDVDVVMLDLWMFRTPAGKVGMVMLHYRRGDAAHADAALVVVGDDADEEGDEAAGVNCQVPAAAPAPSSPSEPNGGGGAVVAAEAAGAPEEVAASSSPSEPDGVAGAKAAGEQAGAPSEEADGAPSTSPELHGGAGRIDEVTTPLSSGGGALMVMMVEVKAASRATTQLPLDLNDGGAANEIAAPPQEQAGGGADTMAAEDDESADELADEAAARAWNLRKEEYQAARGLVMLSTDTWIY